MITVKEISLFCFKRNSYFQFLDGRVTETFSKCSKLQPTGIHKKYTIVGPNSHKQLHTKKKETWLPFKSVIQASKSKQPYKYVSVFGFPKIYNLLFCSYLFYKEPLADQGLDSLFKTAG